MIHSVIAWNVRGLGNPNKRAKIKRLLKRWNPSIVGLTETKWKSCDNSLISSISGTKDSEWVAKNSNGASGGIAIFWKPTIYKALTIWEGRFSLAVRLKIIETEEIISFLVVYGPQEKEEKREFLKEIEMVCREYLAALCIIGDFNLVRTEDDFMGCPRDCEIMEEFNSMICRCNLVELPLQGARYTWSRGGSNRSSSRIDRALINTSFEQMVSPDALTALDRVESDHNPIMLQWGIMERIKHPWRFENMWLQEDSFLQSLVGWWNVPVNGTSHLVRFGQKSRQSKLLIKQWNREHFGKVEKRIAELLIRIKNIDEAEDAGVFNPVLVSEKAILKCELERVLIMEEISWRQRSREVWLQVGDKNTGYFHRVAKVKSRRKKIKRIVIDGRSTEDGNEIKSAFQEHFTAKYMEEEEDRPFPTRYRECRVSLEDSDALVVPFTEKEVWIAISQCNGSKAPGPDGYTIEFFKKAWGIIKSDLLKAFDDFFLAGSLPQSIAHAFICLLPKKDSVEMVSDFRPISLLGSVNKIIAKVLFNRLQPHVNNLISDYQFAGKRGKVIHESCLIANEVIDSRRRSGKPGLVIKLDIEKAFDSISWECILKALEHLGIHSRFRKWIKGMIASSRLSTLINGESIGFFGMSRGIKQGDPLSPFLFNIGMDILSFIICEIKNAGHINGFCFDEENRQGEITHLLYADDAILFCEANEDEVRNTLAALVCFQAISGLQINLEKTKMFPVGDVPNIDRLVEIFGCEWAFLPTIYLGVPLGCQSPPTSHWDKIVNRTQNRLEGWKGLLLSLGGRVVLINSVLASQCTYMSSLFLIPKNVIKTLEKIQRDFLWSGTQEKERFHLVSWDLCKTAKKRGGLGIRDLELHNQALLMKWHWRYATERSSWWRECINFKFPNQCSEWYPGNRSGRIGGSPWAVIMKLQSTFWKLTSIDHGNGFWTSFWFDTWVNGIRLADEFPRVCAAAEFPNSTIADYLSFSEGNVSWNIPLLHSLRGGAERERVRLFDLLNSIPSHNSFAGPERPIWRPSPTASFSVHSAFEHFAAARFKGVENFPSKTVWHCIIPSKICIFLWLVFHKRILTIDNLKRKGISLPNRCALCKVEEESANHIFTSCGFSRQVWCILKSFVKIDNRVEEAGDISERIRRWQHNKPNNPAEWCTRVALHAFCWHIWLERNSRIFREVDGTIQLAALKIGHAIFWWLVANRKVEKEVAESWFNEMKARLFPTVNPVPDHPLPPAAD
ncbi:unnamed protein product [Linum tenue]|uniref:Reverse transcriptase domain-containing protein n=1 Tax=Linum tenue TaxID=586396 RepID=A0AAV0RE76_9ROSI|nr:unnamed protein product [Linum tenue]